MPLGQLADVGEGQMPGVAQEHRRLGATMSPKARAMPLGEATWSAVPTISIPGLSGTRPAGPLSAPANPPTEAPARPMKVETRGSTEASSSEASPPSEWPTAATLVSSTCPASRPSPRRPGRPR